MAGLSMIRRAGLLLSVVVVLVWTGGGRTAAGEGCPERLALGIPPRPQAAATGSAFARRAAGLSEPERERAIAAELMSGNLPGFLRRLKPVTFAGQTAGRQVRVTICVIPDYLAIGSDEDFLRIPMALGTALAVAERFGFVLPTARMVDAIYREAEVHLTPQPLPPTDAMRSTAFYERHQRDIHRQRLALGAPLGALIAGQKKDLVLTERLRRKPGRVAIYGWHRSEDDPIQPLSTVHGAGYADYSHGVRLVSAMAEVDGRPWPVFGLLEDPSLAPVVNDEGVIPGAVALVHALESRWQVAGLGPAAAGEAGTACTAVC